jgi:hypothetical protein
MYVNNPVTQQLLNAIDLIERRTSTRLYELLPEQSVQIQDALDARDFDKIKYWNKQLGKYIDELDGITNNMGSK